jgi:hypothetical protein
MFDRRISSRYSPLQLSLLFRKASGPTPKISCLSQKTLDYLFRDLIPRADFKETFTFIYDRTRAIRTDFTIQHENGPLAIECFQRCARFSIIGVHFFVGTNEWDANYDIAVRQCKQVIHLHH